MSLSTPEDPAFMAELRAIFSGMSIAEARSRFYAARRAKNARKRLRRERRR